MSLSVGKIWKMSYFSSPNLFKLIGYILISMTSAIIKVGETRATPEKSHFHSDSYKGCLAGKVAYVALIQSF